MVRRRIFWKTCAGTILNNYIFLFPKGYRLITDDGYCTHSNGKVLHDCFKDDASDCATDCSGFNWCIGYFYRTLMNDHCSLIPSSRYFTTCPNGYYEHSDIHRAETADDLVVFPFSGWACYAKNQGIIKLILFDPYSYIYTRYSLHFN